MECDWVEKIKASEKIILRSYTAVLIVSCLLWFLIQPFRAYQIPAVLGHRTSQRNLAFCYLVGRAGAGVDYKNAIKWFRTAAEDGDLDAVAYLVMIYSKGIGVEPSMLKATKWFLKGSSDVLMEGWGVLKEELQKEWDKL